MDAQTWLLDQAQEDALHATRLINIEERPFQRISKALLGKSSTIRSAVSHYPSPPPEDPNNTEQDPSENRTLPDPVHLQSFRDHILLDFAALDSSLVRIQLLHNSNARERARFAAEKAKILATAQAVRDDTLQLRARLAQAQTVLQLRKGYDELAAKILDDGKLKSRDESLAQIEALQKEIEDLRQESAEFAGTWTARREGFDRLVQEGQTVLRLIRGIKEDDADKDEEMDEGDGPDDEDDEEGTKDGENPSRFGSEAPEGRTPSRVGPGDHHHADTEASTPANKFLDVDDDAARAGSRAASPLPRVASGMENDVEMDG